jgi:hypothetical protein
MSLFSDRLVLKKTAASIASPHGSATLVNPDDACNQSLRIRQPAVSPHAQNPGAAKEATAVAAYVQ